MTAKQQTRPGEAIHALRTARGWSQDELANRSGVAQPQISRCEQGLNLSFGNLCRIADALGVAVDKLRATP